MYVISKMFCFKKIRIITNVQKKNQQQQQQQQKT